MDVCSPTLKDGSSKGNLNKACHYKYGQYTAAGHLFTHVGKLQEISKPLTQNMNKQLHQKH